MTDETTTPAERPEHELTIEVVTSAPKGFSGGLNHSEDLLASCVCGWRHQHASNQRDARRAFDRHVRKVAQGGTDLGDTAVGLDDPSAVLARHRGV